MSSSSLAPQNQSFTSPGRAHLWWGIACTAALAVGLLRGNAKDWELTNGDYVMMAVAALAALYFFIRARQPLLKITFSTEGIWTRDSGMVDWEHIESLGIETRHGYEGIKRKCLIIKHWENREVLLDIADLNTSPVKLSPIVDSWQDWVGRVE